MKRDDNEIARLRRTRRWRIILRSVQLFSGIVLALYGFIDLVVVKSLDANFNNILIFTICEIVAIPLMRKGIIMFRKMPIEQEITAAVEQLVHTQENLSNINAERLKLIRGPVKAEKLESNVPEKTILPKGEDLITFEQPIAVCPECGEGIKDGAKICRNCGHLFV